MKHHSQAAEFQVEKWLNTEQPLSLASLKGKVVVVAAFQMLCPGCVEHCLPQAKRLRELFSQDDVAVLGLHTVFEHHEAMSEVSLRAFLYEYRIQFPVAIDMPSENSPTPKTMETYQMQGTPTLLLVDAQGNLRRQYFGRLPDMQVGAEVMALVLQKSSTVGDNIETKNAEVCKLDGFL